MRNIFKYSTNKTPKVSIILTDWSCRESLHSLRFLANQDVDRSEFQVIWVEYYNRVSDKMISLLAADRDQGRPPSVDDWIVIGMPESTEYHRHLMYNVGLAHAKGEIVTICDSDAIYRPDFIRTVISEFESDPNIVLHIDQLRGKGRDHYPFDYPEFEALERTLGADGPGGSKVYDACFSAKQEAIVAIGGADEHASFAGYASGPYDLTFRLVNIGLRETWSSSHVTYHTWHPGSDGDKDHVGPCDDRKMSSTALSVIGSGRTEPLVQNRAIGLIRDGAAPADAIDQLVDPDYRTVLDREQVAKQAASWAAELAKEGAAAPSAEPALSAEPAPPAETTLDEVAAPRLDDEFHERLDRLEQQSLGYRQAIGRMRQDLDAARAERERALDEARATSAKLADTQRRLTETERALDDARAVAVKLQETECRLADKERTFEEARTSSARLAEVERRLAEKERALEEARAVSVKLTETEWRLVEKESERLDLEATVRELKAKARYGDEKHRQVMRRYSECQARHGRLDLVEHGVLHPKAQRTVAGLSYAPGLEPAHVIYGPYCPVPAGEYRLNIVVNPILGNREPPQDEIVLTIDALVGERPIANVGLSSAELAEVGGIEFEIPAVPAGQAADVEIRLFNHGTVGFNVSCFELVRMDSPATAS